MSEPVIVLYILRHGATSLNLSGYFRGNANPPLAPEGLRDAHHLAEFFRDDPASFVVASDRTRATQTANIVGKAKNIDVHLTPVLRALNIGDFSGKPRSPENVEALKGYIEHPDQKIPGGESLEEFRSRICPAIWEAIEIADDSGLPGMLVAHSSIVHEASNMILGDHTACLVEPGGAVALFVHKGKLGMDAILKPVPITSSEKKGDTIS